MQRLAIVMVLASVAAGARPARAGSCGGDEEVVATVKAVERFAQRGGAAPVIGEFCDEEALEVPRLAKRLFAACELILPREPGYQPCLTWAADDGRQTVGGVDVYPQLAKLFAVDPFEGAYNVGMYKRLGDWRAAAPVREAWQAALSDPRTTGKYTKHLWLVFRNNAIGLFTEAGGAAERDFLAAQLASTRDRAMVTRMKKAIAAIDKRIHKP